MKIAGVKYQFLREQDDGKIVMAKKKGEGAITMQSTKTAVVIAHVEEGRLTHNMLSTRMSNF